MKYENEKIDSGINSSSDYSIDNEKKLMGMDYGYPDQSDPHIQKKIYEKIEFQSHKTQPRKEIKQYEDLEEYRNNICGEHKSLHEHQALLRNLINPDTPYKGILVMHGLGTGKTCVGVAIAETFKSLVQKYGTKIIVLVPGPLMKETWKEHIVQICTGETYMKHQDKSIYIDEAERQKNERNGLAQALQYYKLMSYRSFYRHVLGEKIIEKKVDGKATYRRDEEGEFERDVSVDRIYNLNNTVIIVDEAHNLTENSYGEALSYIIKNSINLKVVLMSATPMKNTADSIVELINFLRPEDSKMERDKIFTSAKGQNIEFKEGGEEYLRKMISGYISHIRGSDSYLFAKRVDKGIVTEGLQFTPVIPCKMLDFQLKTYKEAVAQKSYIDEPDEQPKEGVLADTKSKGDALDKKSEAAANFVFPSLSPNKKEIIGCYGKDGLLLVKSQLKSHGDLLNKKISEMIFGHGGEKDMISMNNEGKNITGKILKSPYLKYFSIKFYKALKKINRLVCDKKGAKTAFIYSNLVKVGVEIFTEILLQNGYLEYQEQYSNYQISSNTVCYFCGREYKDHDKKNSTVRNLKRQEIDNDSDLETTNKQLSSAKLEKSASSTEEKYIGGDIPKHAFFPATFISVTGNSGEESLDSIPEDKKRILKNAYSSLENKEGKLIKIVLGSRVMNEGLSLRNVGEVFILDVYFNLGRVDQVAGRAIRWCSHHRVMSKENPFPEVNVYKFVVTLDGDMSSEEKMYKRAEIKYILVKKVERIAKEMAIDCPLNYHGNMFKEEIDKYKDCGKEGKEKCPAICDYTNCSYKCYDPALNSEYYDPNNQLYKKIRMDKIDRTTFNNTLARNEIDYAKQKIKEMYGIGGFMFMLSDILNYVKESYDEDKRDMFSDFFVFKGLYEMTPTTENDFNNFKDTIIDKFNRTGYLIYVDKWYIFQPFDENENIPMYYRTTNYKNISNQVSLYSYLKNSKYSEISEAANELKNISIQSEEEEKYDFESTMEYYDSRDEYQYVGFIDKEMNRRKNKSMEEVKDVFKLREKRAKILEKKRGTGIPSLKGAVCSTSKDKKYLIKVANKLRVNIKNTEIRGSLCKDIEERMLFLEKYSTEKAGNKFTYVMVPANHPKYKFPYNLEDRVQYILDKLNNAIKFKISSSIKNKKNKVNGEDVITYSLIIKHDSKLNDYKELLEKTGAIKKDDDWVVEVD